MNIGVGWLGIGVGAAGFVATYLLAAGSASSGPPVDAGIDRKRAWWAECVTLLITLAFFRVSMRTHPPFSPGQGLGYGLLIGGIAGAMACLLSLRFDLLQARSASVRTSQLCSHSMAFFGVLAVSTTYLVFHGYPQVALIGFSIGAVMGAILRHYTKAISTHEHDLGLCEVWAFFSITLAASIVLAVQHFSRDSVRLWWPLPILIATTICAAGFAATEIGAIRWFADRRGAGLALATLIGALASIGLIALYSWRMVGDWRLLGATVAGMLAAAVIAWLVRSAERSGDEASGLEAGALCVMVVVALAVAAFKLWSGLGIGIGLISAYIIALPVSGLCDADGKRLVLPRTLTTALALGLSILLFRLFIQSYKFDLGSADLRIHYTFIGALLGAVVPFVFTSSLIRLREIGRSGVFAGIIGVAILGLFAAASPIVLFAIWQIKAVLGFTFGLTAALAFLMLAQLFRPGESKGDSLPAGSYSVGLLVIGAQLVAVQFVGPLLTLEMTRATRIIILAAAAAAGILWLALTGIIAKSRAR